MILEGSRIGEPEYVEPNSAWLGHGPFAMWLVHAQRPDTLVELGTHHGYSYFCFCQAVVEARLKTRCFAVDTWKGDVHSGHYDNSVYLHVQERNRPFAHFSTLLRKTFAEALDDVADGTVDLLHVDGRHFYDDVRQDFEQWIPKLSARSVVLFHDTEVRERGFGVWRYWSEIENDKPSFNFPHQHGLGVLLWGEDVAPGLRWLLPKLKKPKEVRKLRKMFERLGLQVSNRATLKMGHHQY